MWIDDLPTMVFTRIKAEGTKRLKQRYPDIFFTNSDRVQTQAKFPTVYIQKQPGRELGRTFEKKGVNGIQSDYQIEVTDNESQNNAFYVSGVIKEIMHDELGYEIVTDTFPNNDTQTYKAVTRYSRPIGFNDKF